ncbi:hypothetical protein GCM10028790_33540 [Micromonospora taraxaci]
MASATSSYGTNPARHARTQATNRLDRRGASVAAPVAGVDMPKGYVVTTGRVSTAAPAARPAPNCSLHPIPCPRPKLRPPRHPPPVCVDHGVVVGDTRLLRGFVEHHNSMIGEAGAVRAASVPGVVGSLGAVCREVGWKSGS